MPTFEEDLAQSISKVVDTETRVQLMNCLMPKIREQWEVIRTQATFDASPRPARSTKEVPGYRLISPTLTFGNGDYSCASCGMGLDMPCEHWRLMFDAIAKDLKSGKGVEEKNEL